MRYEFRVDGDPVAQPRPKIRFQFPKAAVIVSTVLRHRNDPRLLLKTLHGLCHANAYVPQKHPVHKWRNHVAAEALKTDVRGITEPVAVDLVFLMPRTTAITWKRKPMPRLWYDKATNDADNLAKAVMDALTHVKYWKDDGQVVDLRVRRMYADGSEPPGVIIVVTTDPGTDTAGEAVAQGSLFDPHEDKF